MEEDDNENMSENLVDVSVGSASDSDAEPNFLDDEAVESGDESQSSSDDGSSDSDDGEEPRTFHGFSRLPPELRRQIWECFCPELVFKSRLLDITVGPPSERHAHAQSWPPDVRPWTARDGHTLDSMTLTTRRVLAVNRESRSIAMQVYPDYLCLDLASGDAIVRFNKQTDVILLTGYGMDYHDTGKYHFPDFADRITQLAISATLGYNSTAGDSADHKLEFLRQFPNLKRTFFLMENLQHGTPKNLKWCVPDYIHELYVETFEESPGLGEDMQMVFCWPNVDEHRVFHELYRKTHDSLPQDLDQEELISMGIDPYPMAIFQFESGMAQYRELQEMLLSAPPDVILERNESSEEESSESEEEDEYESDGIDDGSIHENSESSEDEIIPDHISAGSGSPSNTGSPGQFSSPEPESAHRLETNESTSNGVSLHSRNLKRRIVSDSEDEEEQEEPKAKRARVARGAIVDSSDDEVSVQAIQPQKRNRKRAVLSDSESSEGGADTGAKNLERPTGSSESEEEDDEEEQSAAEDRSEEEEDKPRTTHMSLAERLRQHRKENPIPESEDEGSQTADERDSDEESFDEEDSEIGGGLIDGMAVESDEDDDEEGDGYEEW
ncbi:hypothetical protein HJFPF1_10109 [Paramyrothecium foliicola]|nr:hypothetical protein HJFPF1_10109 [Paramyrothecium foliicola]